MVICKWNYLDWHCYKESCRYYKSESSSKQPNRFADWSKSYQRQVFRQEDYKCSISGNSGSVSIGSERGPKTVAIPVTINISSDKLFPNPINYFVLFIMHSSLLYIYNFHLIKNTHLRHVTVHYFSVLHNRKPYFFPFWMSR
jgi:hypothetical protein